MFSTEYIKLEKLYVLFLIFFLLFLQILFTYFERRMSHDLFYSLFINIKCLDVTLQNTILTHPFY